MITVRPPAGYEPRGGSRSDPAALIGEARRRQRRRRRRAVLALIAVLALAVAVTASVRGLAGRAGRPPSAAPRGHVPPMPSQLVAWTRSFRVEVLSSRSGRVTRVLASDVALYQGLPTVTVSAAGVVYFDDARGGQEWVMSVPLAGGPVTTVAAGRDPAISPNGQLLAYVTSTGTTGGPEAIVVKNLAGRTQRSRSFSSLQPYITGLSWSPGGTYLSFTAATGLSQVSAWLLEPGSAGEPGSARRIPLRAGLQWAGFLTPDAGLAVMARAGHPGRQDLVEVSVRSGQVLRQLTSLPASGLFTANASDGTEGAITADPSGHYLLIAAGGPDGYGEIFRWAMGTHHLADITRGAIRAAWVIPAAG